MYNHVYLYLCRSFFQPLARTKLEKETAEKDHLEENLTPKRCVTLGACSGVIDTIM